MLKELDFETQLIIKKECTRAWRKLPKAWNMSMYQPEDFYTTAWIAASKATESYKPELQNKNKYICIQVRNRILDYVRQILPMSRDHYKKMVTGKAKIGNHVDIINVSHKANIDKEFDRIDLIDTVNFISRDSSARDKKILYNIVIEGYNQADVSKELGITISRIGQIVKPMFNDLRHHLEQ